MQGQYDVRSSYAASSDSKPNAGAVNSLESSGTVGTFFITAATGFISLRWDTPQGGIALISAVVFGMGVILFLIFSALTFDETNKQRENCGYIQRDSGAENRKVKEAFALEIRYWAGDCYSISACVCII